MSHSKKEILADWQKAFPELTVYSANKLFKIVGPVIIGIELINLPRTPGYRPHFVIYSLWGNRMGSDVKACLDGPILLHEFHNEKRLQYSILYEKHNTMFPQLIKQIADQMLLSFKGDLPLSALLKVFDAYSKNSVLAAAPNSFLQAALQGNKLSLALYIDRSYAERILTEIIGRNWDLDHFKLWDIDLKVWLDSLREKVHNRDHFLHIINTNKNDKALKKLQVSELYAG